MSTSAPNIGVNISPFLAGLVVLSLLAVWGLQKMRFRFVVGAGGAG